MSQTKAQLIDPVDGTIVNADINASAAIAGSKISPSFTSDVTITDVNPALLLVDSNNNSDYELGNQDGTLRLRDSTNTANRMTLSSTGQFDFEGNVDCNNGLDVSGANLTVDAQIVSTGSILVDDGTNARITITKNSATNARLLATTTGFAAYTNLEIRSSTVNFKNAGNTQTLTLDASGRLLVGATTSRSPLGVSSLLQVEGLDSSTAISISRNSANQHGGYFLFNKSRGAALGSDTIVQDDDTLGSIYWCGNDGNDSDHAAAFITAEVDATPGTNDIPGRLRFATTSDNASSATERMRIDSSGNVGIGVVPESGQYSGYNHLQVGESATLSSNDTQGDTNVTNLTQNTYLNANASAWKYLHTDEASRYQQHSGSHFFGIAASGSADATITFSQKLTIDTDGVKFNGDGSAANALNDYEEGTYTPSFGYATDDGNKSYLLQVGQYTKIGSLVNVNIGIQLNNRGTGSGAVTISLPFTVADVLSGTSIEASGQGRYFFGLASSVTSIGLLASHSSTNATLHGTLGNAASASSTLTYAFLGNNASFRFSITYRTT